VNAALAGFDCLVLQSTPNHPLKSLHKSVLGFTYEMLDADRDGTVTQKEYNAGFGVLDSDGGGSLSRKEFGLGSVEHFDMLDVNRDGILTKVCTPAQQKYTHTQTHTHTDTHRHTHTDTHLHPPTHTHVNTYTIYVM